MNDRQPSPYPAAEPVPVRRARPDDARALAAIAVDALADKYRPALGRRAATAAAALIAAGVGAGGPSIHLVAEIEGRIAGVAHLMPGPHSRYPAQFGLLREAVGPLHAARAMAVFALLAPGSIAADTGYIDELAVAPWARGRGVARALLADCARRAGTLDLRRMELLVTADNAPALALYRSFGFEEVARRRWWLRRALFRAPGALTLRWQPSGG